jgi:hypothetical protein
MQKETKNLPLVAQIPKVMNPCTRALAPPFYRETKGLLHSKTPSHSKNIANVNTYMNVFFISYIYKPATSSHPKPGLFGTTTLTLHLTSSWISLFVTSEPDLWHILEFTVSWSSWLRRFKIPDFRMFATPRLHRFKLPESRAFATPRLRRFEIPENRIFAIPRLRGFKIPENRECFAPEKHILRTSLNSTFRGWQVFLNSPTSTMKSACLLSLYFCWGIPAYKKTQQTKVITSQEGIFQSKGEPKRRYWKGQSTLKCRTQSAITF